LVLVIHGTEDEVIDFSHGMAIHEKCQKPVDPLWVEGAGHNDIEIYAQYIERLKRFINEEIRNHQYSIMAATHAQQLAAALNNTPIPLPAPPVSTTNGITGVIVTPGAQTNQPTSNTIPPLKTDVLIG
jgi:hypothetical protein